MQASVDESLARRGSTLLAEVAALPGGPELLEICRADGDSALVGGAVRDLLLGREPRELDVVVRSGGALLAGALAEAVRGTGAEPRVRIHERFRTAAVEWPGGRVDIAERRAESYPRPGALPEVRPGTAIEDLQRRDFTVNAMAVTLGGADAGAVLTAEHAGEDLAGGRLRVLHERSFIDDPTRLLRLARYAARLGFEPEPGTAALARRALQDGALGAVSAARTGAELRLALQEAGALSSLQAMADLGALQGIDPRLGLDGARARRALELLPPGARPDILALACLLAGSATGAGAREQLVVLLDGLEFGAGERDRAIRAAAGAPELAAAIAAAARPSQLMRAAAGREPEDVALAGAEPVPGAREGALRWLEELRHVRLAINGQDLIAAGIPSGPEIGRRLELALERRLDGELAAGREAELAAALEGER